MNIIFSVYSQILIHTALAEASQPSRVHMVLARSSLPSEQA